MNVGDYVRTKNGGIGKIIKCPFKSMYLDEIWGDIENTETIITDNVYKTSPNIIDLIEVGDYVNGVRVEEVLKKEDLCFIYLENGFDDVDNDYVLENGIVTKEMFEQMECKIQ